MIPIDLLWARMGGSLPIDIFKLLGLKEVIVKCVNEISEDINSVQYLLDG